MSRVYKEIITPEKLNEAPKNAKKTQFEDNDSNKGFYSLTKWKQKEYPTQRENVAWSHFTIGASLAISQKLIFWCMVSILFDKEVKLHVKSYILLDSQPESIKTRRKA